MLFIWSQLKPESNIDPLALLYLSSREEQQIRQGFHDKVVNFLTILLNCSYECLQKLSATPTSATALEVRTESPGWQIVSVNRNSLHSVPSVVSTGWE